MLQSMAGCLSTFLQLTSKELAHAPARRSTPAQRQLALSPPVVGFSKLESIMDQIFTAWGTVISDGAALVPTVARTMLPLLQQLQRCSSSKLLPAKATAATGSGGGSTLNTVDAVCKRTLQSVYRLQSNSGMMLYEFACMTTEDQLQPAVRAQIAPLLKDPTTAELLLQLLTAETVLLHRRLDAEQQQQQLSSRSRGCSSSNASGVGQHQDNQSAHALAIGSRAAPRQQQR
jgi:hypothetical protein